MIPPAPAPFPERPDPVRTWARLRPDAAALVDADRGRRWSYLDLDALADAWAAELVRRGVEDGDRVATLAGNRWEQVALFLACGRTGAALVPLNWRLSEPELAAIVEDAVPRLIFADADRMDAARAAARGAVPVEAIGLDPPPVAGGGRAGPTPDPEAAVLVLYTSGSTGRPKGAVLPHRQLFHNAVATCAGWDLGPDDVAPVGTPLFHTGGWNVFATPLWHVGGTVVLIDGFDPDGFLTALADEACTVALTVPTQLLMLTEAESWGRPLPALRFFISGGAPCPPALAARTREAGYRFKEGYGLTECGPNCFAISLEEAEARPGSVGRPVPFLHARLVDPEGRDVPDGEPGELLLRGPQVFGGYLGDPERTAEAFTDDGWLRTGDLAVVDEAGAYRICGRRKEMFISGGENVFPAEVEAILADGPGVAEAVVVGAPDPRWGEVGHAFVVAAAGEDVDPESLRAWARERLAAYKVPRRVTVLDAIPRLGSGKPDRGSLAARAEVDA